MLNSFEQAHENRPFFHDETHTPRDHKHQQEIDHSTEDNFPTPPSFLQMDDNSLASRRAALRKSHNQFAHQVQQRFFFLNKKIDHAKMFIFFAKYFQNVQKNAKKKILKKMF